MFDLRKFIRRYHSTLSSLALVFAVVLILWTVNSPAIVGASATQRLLPIYSVQREDKIVAISFDAAWGNEDTQTLIDILRERGLTATFFVVGDWVDRYPESVKALAAAGNEVMNHSLSLAHFSTLGEDEIVADVSA